MFKRGVERRAFRPVSQATHNEVARLKGLFTEVNPFFCIHPHRSDDGHGGSPQTAYASCMNPHALAEVLVSDWSDLIAFDHPFIVSPDLHARIANHWPLHPVDPTSMYDATGKGYTDFPTYRP